MTLFNHFKYHFTQWFSIPSTATEKTKAHQVSICRLAAWRSHTCANVTFQKENVWEGFGVKAAKWEKMKRIRIFITVKSRRIWLLPSTRLKCPSFDSWCSFACIQHILWAMILIWPSDPSWWNRSNTQFSACLIFQCQNYLPGGGFVSAFLQADHPLE